MLWRIVRDTHDEFAGIANPHYVLFHDYYGDVYAKYVGHMMVILLGLFGFLRPLLLT
jgi:hypothetical protein